MKDNMLLYVAGAVLAGALAGYGLTKVAPPAVPLKKPAEPLKKPAAPKDEPKCPRCPRGDSEPAVDLLAVPSQFRKPNINARRLGCCVFRSLDYASRWQNVPALWGMPEWMVSKDIQGGGVPAKVRALVPRIAADRGQPVPRFVQYEGSDPSIIELALRTGRPASVTWGGNHMLSCVHLDSERAAIVDNNAPEKVQWMSRERFLSGWRRGGGGWVVVLLAPGPPPAPANVRPKQGKDCLCSALCVCGCNQGRECHCEGSRPHRQPEPQPQPEPGPGPTPWPDLEPADLPAIPDPGVEWTYGGAELYTLGEEVVTKIEAESALADDSAKLHLTVIGTPAERATALQAIGPLAEKHHVQVYDRGDWALGCGFCVEPEGPTVYLQTRDGAVLLRASGVVGLAEKLRRVDPSYDPRLDPDGSPLASVPDQARQAAPYGAGCAGLLLLLYLLRRSKGGTETRSAPVQQPQQPAAPPSALDEVALKLGRELLARKVEELPRTP